MPISKLFRDISRDLFQLFYPNTCIACAKVLDRDLVFCPQCQFSLPFTGFEENIKSNDFANRLKNRIEFEGCSALFWYVKASRVQKMVHKLKYKDRPDIAKILGKLAGDLWSNHLNGIDYLVPIPLHKERQKWRGYNQSEEFAKGISDVTNIPVNTSILFRDIHTSTQTNKNTAQRMQNVLEIFSVKSSKSLENKHLLLLDDVVTSGATFDAAANTILNNYKNVKISCGAIAIADHWA